MDGLNENCEKENEVKEVVAYVNVTHEDWDEQLVSILQYCNRREVKINRIYYERDNSNFKEWKKLCDSINGNQTWSEIVVSTFWKVFETHEEFIEKINEINTLGIKIISAILLNDFDCLFKSIE